MKSKNLWKKVTGTVGALAFIFGAALMYSTPVQAQGSWDRDREIRQDRDRNWDQDRRDRDDRYGRDRDDRYGRNGGGNYRIALDQGFQSGRNTGASDASRGQSFDPQRSHFYKNATYGYNGYGSKDAYRQAYREGFVRGYREGYERYGGNRRRGGGGRWFPNF